MDAVSAPAIYFSDCDETAVNTFVDLQDGARDIEFLTPVPGFREFLEERPNQVIIVSIAGEEKRQRKKLEQVGFLHLVREVMVMGDLDSKINLLVGLANKYRPLGIPLIGVGDRIDNDIVPFNLAGITSFRMVVPGGKYTSQQPQSLHEQPYRVVTNGFELSREVNNLLLPR